MRDPVCSSVCWLMLAACSTPLAPTAPAQPAPVVLAEPKPAPHLHAEAAEPACGQGACGQAACSHSECSGGEHPAATAQADSPGTAQAQPSGALIRIGERGGVCMLSNRYLGERADVPIQVEGKTYHGCCANCAARLGSMADARMANDPVTGHPVDKGAAVLARDTDNRVYYFESEATLARHTAQLRPAR